MIRRTLILASIFLFSIFSLSANSDTTRVVILSVNDMHAKIDNFPRFKSLIDSIKQVYEHVLVLSAGDNFTGNPVVDQYPDKGYPIIDMMNYSNFNATVVGNHEFDYGQEVLEKRISQAGFPFLAANITFTDKEKSLRIQPYTFLNLKKGIRIGLLGLIQINPAGLPDTHPSRLSGIKFTSGIETAKDFLWIKDSCDVFVVLSHLGFEDDVVLAENTSGIDLIIGGHTHTVANAPKEFNGTLVTQAGSNLRYVTMTTLCLVDKQLVKKSAQLLKVSDHKGIDQGLQTLLEKYNDNKELNTVIGKALNDISGKDELGCLMTDGMAAVDPVEIAFQNNGGIRVDKIPQGDITIKDIYKLDPFGNEIVLFNLNASEIKELIITSFNRDNNIDLQASGITYSIVQNEAGQATDAIIIMSNGKPIDLNKDYNVGMSSYIASSYDFSKRDQGTSLYITTAQSLINFIKEKKEVDYKGFKRAKTEKAE